MHMFQRSHSSCYFESELNKAHIVLIPKVPFPYSVKEYRPISLCNSSYKLIAKFLSNRLKTVLSKLISPFQHAFIAGRQISNNAPAHKVLHLMANGSRRTQEVAIKVDINKAYDKLEWALMLKLLKVMGFSERWVSWINSCISLVSCRVIVNMEFTRKSSSSRGICQGDPLSPTVLLTDQDRRGRSLLGLQVKLLCSIHLSQNVR
ncbi:hypothetical protein Syun_007140 [Stephania yunnanensis]|uniref:Reverse transcriptase domain-containing protein n=1 Tax=Stephania yunnanensis TaxID=152371 RepID=A0AAP0L1F9_9MAGN